MYRHPLDPHFSTIELEAIHQQLEEIRRLEEHARLMGFSSFKKMMDWVRKQDRIPQQFGFSSWQPLTDQIERTQSFLQQFSPSIVTYGRHVARHAHEVVEKIQSTSSLKQVSKPSIATGDAATAKETEKAAEEFVILEMLKDQPALVKGPDDCATLIKLNEKGQFAEIDKSLRRRAAKCIAYWKSKLGRKGGRPRKPLEARAGYARAFKVDASLKRFEGLFRKKHELEKRIKRRKSSIKAGLIKAGATQEEAEATISSPKAWLAACAWVAETQGEVRSPKTIENDFRRYRNHILLFSPTEPSHSFQNQPQCPSGEKTEAQGTDARPDSNGHRKP